MRFIYGNFYTTLPVDRHVILFESFHGKEVSDSPLAMVRAFFGMPGSENYKVYFSTTDAERDQVLIDALNLDIELVHIHSDEYAKLLATAGYLINNSSFPSYFIKREDQTYLQTWHGTPWKTLGKRMHSGIETMYNVQHNFLQADYLLFPNEFTRDAIMADYNLSNLFTGKVILSGYPRNSVFNLPDKAAEIKHLCGDDGYSTIAYMPTWRGQDNSNIQTDKFVTETLSLLSELDASLADNQKLYVNLHPIIQKSINLTGFSHIYPFPADIDKYEFINSTDALMTDYSSIFFDYSITGKPIILFTYDYDEYSAERGLYFDIEKLPFIKVSDIDDLKVILSEQHYLEADYSSDKEYHNKYIKYDSADAASLLMRFILGDKTTGLTVEDYSGNMNRSWDIIDCPNLKHLDDLDNVAELASAPNKLALFYTSNFNPKLSRYMMSNYSDSFEYIFTTKSTPLSYKEKLIHKNPSEIRKRELLRKVGRLNINSVTKYASPEAEVISISARGQYLSLVLKCPAPLGTITDVVASFRSNVEDISHSFDYTVRQDGSNNIITAKIDTSVFNHGCVYWDFSIIADKDGESVLIEAGLDSSMQRKMLLLFYQCCCDGYVTFPHISLRRTLAFTHREYNRYDSRFIWLKELSAFTVYKLFGSRFSERDIWLVYEKFCSAAQDNGYYFFRYCMENLTEEEKKDIYYVIDKNSDDYSNVAKYGSHIIQFMSFKHMLYCMRAKLYVGSDSKKHLYAWRPMPNMISRRMKRKDTHFLQHGVTALKRVDNIFGRDGSSPMTSITTTSEYEQSIMTEYFGYTALQSPVVGFTRWDVLEDKSSPDEKIILVMPTWRAWLEEQTDEYFMKSDYFKNYMTMLQDESLDTCLTENKVKLIFFIHPKFKDFLNEFSSNSRNVEFIQFGEKPLNEIMMRSSMLVTDYSSVCWDMYYMSKPVIFYQFDYDMYMENHGSYLDMEHDLFGDRYTELEDVISAIREYIESDFGESEKAKSLRSKYFAYIDNNNSKRTYEYLKSRGY